MPVECWKKGESKLHHSGFLPDEGMTVRDATNCGKDDEPSSKRATEEIFWLLVMQLPGGGPAAVGRGAARRKRRGTGAIAVHVYRQSSCSQLALLMQQLETPQTAPPLLPLCSAGGA